MTKPFKEVQDMVPNLIVPKRKKRKPGYDDDDDSADNVVVHDGVASEVATTSLREVAKRMRRLPVDKLITVEEYLMLGSRSTRCQRF